MSMTTDPAAREAVIAGLRDLADFLAAHPAVAVPEQTPVSITTSPYGTDEECEREIDEFAAAAGVTVTDNRAGGGWHSGRYAAALAFGPVAYMAFTYTAAALAGSDASRSYEANIRTAAAPREMDEAA